MTTLQKFNYILPNSFKKGILFISVLMFFGMLFEMMGIGILLPALAIILNPNFKEEYPQAKIFIELLGNPSYPNLKLYGLLFIILIYVFKAFFLLLVNWNQNKFTNLLSKSLEDILFKGYLNQPYSFHLSRNTAVLLRNINEVAQLTNMTQSFISLIIEISAIVGIVGLIIFIEPKGALVVSLFLILILLVFHRFTKDIILKWGQGLQKFSVVKNQVLLQGLGGVKDIKLMNRGEYFISEFSNANFKSSQIRIKSNTLSQIPRLYIEVFAVMGLVALILSMLSQNKPLHILIPTLGIFAAAAFRIIPSFNRIMSYMQGVQIAKPTINLLYEEFILLNSSQSQRNQTSAIEFKNSIELKDVDFKYNSTNNFVLRGITLEIKKGDTVGFIGPSGSGKSTLIDLILGLINPLNGEILIDKDPLHANTRGWQDKIGYVAQSIYLTDDSLRSNIAFGIDPLHIDDEAVNKAVDAAQLTEFVLNLDEGINTFVGERGVRLSGGQRQRIGIARALYHNPPVLILDEATSSLDNQTEKGFMEAINNLKRNKTIIIVAHRLSTVSQCDKIFKIENGRITLEGIPSEILNNFK